MAQKATKLDLVSKLKQKMIEKAAPTSSKGKSKISAHGHIPDILEFCYSKDYLNLKDQNVTLYPMQQIILKVFYRGQLGNENLKLTQDEIDLLVRYKLDYVIEKYNSMDLFRELVLVLGRRSGKDFLVSIIALYEAMKLLELPGGSPFQYYELGYGNPIYIMTIATSSDQAKVLFNEIKAKLQLSEFFRNKIGAVEAQCIYLLTPEDVKKNAELVSQGIESQSKGSIAIMSGHSNSDSLLGKSIFALLFDEVASYKNTGGSGSGDQLYSKLGPATVTFGRTVGHKPNGEPIRRLDSKIISISSPRTEQGILFKLYSSAREEPNRLAFKLPTWKVNLSITEEMLLKENKYMSPAQFQMEFGANFSGTSGEKFIGDEYIDACVKLGVEIGLTQQDFGFRGQVYYAHLDPATSNHNYALVLIHTEDRLQITTKDGVKTKQKQRMFIVDHIKVWQPTVDKAINVNEVDEYVIELAKRFRLGLVTYDDWQSAASIQKLKSKGIPTKLTKYRKPYKMAIYSHLEQLIINQQLVLPYKGRDAELLQLELKCLKRIYSAGQKGFSIKPDLEGAVRTDDLADALAGACAMAIESVDGSYPKAAQVYMPQSRSDGTRNWQIGRGSFNQQQWSIIANKFKI